jgi:UDP-N-acetylglucosamine diphosphorylase/glucosamine-1-phosphate N-acetyltransferase
MRLVFYEDKNQDLYPLDNLVPRFKIVIGMRTVIEHTRLFLKTREIDFIARSRFGFPGVKSKGPAVYLSSRLLLTEDFKVPDSDCILKAGKEEVGFVKHGAPFPGTAAQIAHVLVSIKGRRQVEGIVINRLWDIVACNERLIDLHFKLLRKRGSVSKAPYIQGKRKNLFIARDAHVHKQVFLDVTDGPVYIDQGAVIRPFTTVVGPSYIGPGSILDRAKITKSTIGPHCRIGGEVESCIFQGYSNKYHEGFIGHSVVGAWVNLGALSTNSDLKNNYGPVRIHVGNREFDTGLVKLGCFVGDHTKLGIGTLIPTGAVIGSFVNFARGGMMPRFVPDFTWMGTGKDVDYRLAEAISTARLVMKRRNVKMSAQYEKLIQDFHEQVRRSD